MIHVTDLFVEYGTGPQAVRAVEDVNFDVDAGSSIALIGPSGCGKTSLLFGLAGLLSPVSGRIEIDGEPVVGPRRSVALILQNAGLLPWKTVWQNANLSLQLAGEYPRQDASGVLTELGLETVQRRFPGELSEGMKRRVGIARALSTAPSVMLMDEPLASLDTLTREKVQDLFLALWKKHGYAMVMVTHDIEEAAYLGRRILVLTERPARIKAVVDNPEMGERSHRGCEAYRGVLLQLREALER
jgi:NitT/TauT family transport system ATP-binding protein